MVNILVSSNPSYLDLLCWHLWFSKKVVHNQYKVFYIDLEKHAHIASLHIPDLVVLPSLYSWTAELESLSTEVWSLNFVAWTLNRKGKGEGGRAKVEDRRRKAERRSWKRVKRQLCHSKGQAGLLLQPWTERGRGRVQRGKLKREGERWTREA